MSNLKKIDVVSMYLNEPVLGGHIISLQLEEDQQGHMKGTAHIDPNSCELDMWGDRGACTRIAITNVEVEATATSSDDPLGRGRVHWELRVAEQPEVTVNLIEYPSEELWYLTGQSEEKGDAVVPLFDTKVFVPC